MAPDRTDSVAASVAASLASTGEFDVRGWVGFATSFRLLCYLGERALDRLTGE